MGLAGVGIGLDRRNKRAQIGLMSDEPKSFIPKKFAAESEGPGSRTVERDELDIHSSGPSIGKVRAKMAYASTNALLNSGEMSALSQLLKMAATDALCEPIELMMWLRTSASAMYTTPEWQALREAFVLQAGRFQLDASRELRGLDDETLNRKYGGNKRHTR